MSTDKEEDLLAFSPGLKKNSRLACGIKVDSKLNDAFITIPELNRNIINEDDMWFFMIDAFIVSYDFVHFYSRIIIYLYKLYIMTESFLEDIKVGFGQ